MQILPFLLVALAGLMLSVPGTYGQANKVWVVLRAKDGPGSCPGAACNLRTAFESAQVNDTIILSVNPIINNPPMTTPIQIANSPTNGFIRISGSPGGSSSKAVIQSTVRPFSLDNWPFAISNKASVRLEVVNVEFTGSSEGFETGVICVSTGTLCKHGVEGSGRTRGRSQRAEAIAHEGVAADLLGSNDTRFGNWSDFLNNPAMYLEGCIFRGNKLMGSTSIYGAIVLGSYTGETNMPIVVNSCMFADNSITGVSPAGFAIQTEWSDSDSGVPVLVTNSQFTNNRQDTTPQPSNVIEGLDGPIVCADGPISMTGCSFVDNEIGGTRAVISASPKDALYHVVIRNTVISGNTPNKLPTDPNLHGAVVASWLVVTGVTMDLPDSVPPVASYSPNDQYFVNSAVNHPIGYAQMNGYQIYNKNPVNANCTTDPSLSPMGIADCKQAMPWVPCPSGTTCKEVMFMSKVSGVECL